ncbi:MAG TPA: threonine aldolase family protein [Ramlibacter sp.]|nr:threonine aldolase family protein [Ramlibacter sp.]
MPAIDLRSDTLTLPTGAMREAMRQAPVGDDGLDGDPSMARLEALAAERLGKDAALFVASGTMGNLVASLTHAVRGGEAIADEHAHLVRNEVGGIARLVGLHCHRLPALGGAMDLDQVRGLLRPAHSREGQPTAMVVVESSHNYSGGAVPSLDYMRALHELAQGAGAAVHLDGARIFNAALSLGVDVREIAALADSVTFCLSKGLSAPMGSLLAGSREFIARARTYRRMVGGGLRQAGSMAAAGIVALKQMTDRLADDHRHASRLWEQLARGGSGLVAETPPATNILMIDVSARSARAPADGWLAELERQGVRLRARDAGTLRAVLHRHISADDVDAAAAVILRVLCDGGGPPPSGCRGPAQSG